jgi:hypothetical protein
MGGVNLAGLWARVEKGVYVAWKWGAAGSAAYTITSRPYGKTRKMWTLSVNGEPVAFMSRGTSLTLAGCKARAQEIENGAEWRPEDAS